jgi:hypothetical protein
MDKAAGCIVSGLVLWSVMAAGAAQELPPGGGPIPELRRGANGQIEVVRPSAPSHREPSRERPAPAASTAKPQPSEVRRNEAPPPSRPAQPVITVTPTTPRVPDTTPPGAVVASYSVTMSDGSSFAGTVRFAAPNFDANRVFALAGNKIIVNPDGPGLGRRAATGTYRITLETVP